MHRVALTPQIKYRLLPDKCEEDDLNCTGLIITDYQLSHYLFSFNIILEMLAVE